MTLGEKLRKLRTEKHFTQNQAAELLSIAQSTYFEWENDKTSPTARNIARLVEVFGITAAELVDPNWTVTLKQPALKEGESGKTVMEGNALRMFEMLYESQQSQLKHLENKVERLQEQLGRLEGQTRPSAVRF